MLKLFPLSKIFSLKKELSKSVEDADSNLTKAYSNYAEAKKVIEENNYTLKLVSVDTFSDALKYLDSIDTFYKD